MNDAATAHDYLGPDGPIARRLSGYEVRPQQLQLTRAVEEALAARGHLLAEAGTGIGKSFAYLLPAVMHALARPGEGPVVVSTRTIALQQQLEHKDLPFLQATLPLEWSVVSAVGRGNYLCRRRLDLARQDGRGLFTTPELEDDLELVAHWAMTTREGTRMDLPRPIAPAVWDEVRAERGNCLHRACPHYEPCAYQRGRRRMATAQVLVVNHSLYMADVALRMAGARYLPPHRVVVFDEAHHLERVATENLGLSLGLGTVRWHLRRLDPRNAARSLLRRYGSDRARTLVRVIGDAADEMFGALAERLEAAPGGYADLGDEHLANPLDEPLGDLNRELMAAAAAIDDLSTRTELLARAQGLEGLRAALTSLCRGGEGGMVRWLERDRSGAALRAAPLEVAGALRTHLFAAVDTAVLVSATLGSGDDDFTWMRGRLGIDGGRALELGSPFDFRTQVEVLVEDDLPDPSREPRAFADAAVERTVAYVTDNGGRALVLCTSWSFLRQVAAGLRAALAAEDIALLVQGEADTATLLRRKQEEPRSVLVGVDTLWEGIDVRGDALTLVVITRLPFAAPDHPLTRARHRSIEARGGSSFEDDSLPDAILRFRQGFGRLVRSHQDRGRVVVLDPRARTRSYGARFLGALPR